MARRKITDGNAMPDASGLPELTGQQMAFVRLILEGKNATDAYRMSYDVSTMQTETIWVAASKLRNDDKVSIWIAAARTACLGSATVTLSGHLQELERLKEIAVATGNVGAAVQAEQLRGKASGHYVERFEDLTAISDPMATLDQLAMLSPDIARKLADDHGVAWTERTQH